MLSPFKTWVERPGVTDQLQTTSNQHYKNPFKLRFNQKIQPLPEGKNIGMRFVVILI